MIREEYEKKLKNSGGNEVDRSVKMSRKEVCLLRVAHMIYSAYLA